MSFAALAALCAGAGFISLSYELIWYRVWSFASLGAPSVFGLLLGVYLAGIANGAMRSRRFCADREATGSARQLLAVAGFLALANGVSWAVVPLFTRLARVTHWFPSLLLIVLATTFLGAVLPLLAHFGIRPDERAGVNLSYLYLANILGSAAGTIVTGFVLMDLWPLARIATFTVCAASILIAIVLVACRLERRRLGAALGALALVTAGAAFATPRLLDDAWERLLWKQKWKGERFAQVVENRSGVITVAKDGTVYGGGAYDGRFNIGLLHDRNIIIRAYALMAMHPAPREVLMIGMGSGSWAQVLAHLPGTEHLTVVEINPGYLDIIGRQPELRSLLSNPKIDIVIDDGRRWLRRHPERRFDLIVSNTTWHYRALITNLLSREFLQLVRAHLREGGIGYYNTTASTDCEKTALAVFPHVIGYSNELAVSDSPIVFDRERWRSALARFEIDGHKMVDDPALLEKTLASADSVRTREVLVRDAASSEVITDDNMVPEFRSYAPATVSPMTWLRELIPW